MSTKNLARTVIEGGRDHYSQYHRRHSHAEERAEWRATRSELTRSVDIDGVLFPERRQVYRGFSDKLGPAERWLARQLGRPWNKVHSELFARFDTRTTAGRHIVFDHLLRDVDRGDPSRSFGAKFYVDAHGTLRRAPKRHYGYEYGFAFEPLPEPRRVLDDWVGERRVGERRPKLYWFVPTLSGRFRQHRALSEEEVARFHTLPEWFRQELDVFCPPLSTK